MLASLHPGDAVTPDTLLAIDDQGHTITCGQLDELRDAWAQKVPGRRLVALFCRNTTASLSAYIGLHAAGHVVILLSAKMSQAARDELIQRYRIEACVEEGEVTLLSEPAGGLHEELAICLSTSGSTGSPKLVQFSSRQLAANARAIAGYLNLQADDKPLAHLPFEYSYGLSVVHSHMCVGATILLTEHGVMQKPFWERLAQATSLSGVPFHYEMLLRMRLGRTELPNMRMLNQAGGRLGAKEAQKLYDLASEKGWQFHIMYGQTEAGPRISWLPFDKLLDHLDFIGQPIPGVRLELTDESELVVHSPAVMLGYAQSRADLMQGDRMGGVLNTGDLAEVVDGLYRITGRKSRFIKLQGNRVGLADVENLMENAGHKVCCVGVDDQLTLFTTEADTDSIRQMAVDLFSFPARSMSVRHIESFPRRSNDKIDYSALQQLLETAQ